MHHQWPGNNFQRLRAWFNSMRADQFGCVDITQARNGAHGSVCGMQESSFLKRFRSTHSTHHVFVASLQILLEYLGTCLSLTEVQSLFARMEVTTDRQTLFRLLRPLVAAIGGNTRYLGRTPKP